MSTIDLNTAASNLTTINEEVHGPLPADGHYAAGKIGFYVDQNARSHTYGMALVWNIADEFPVLMSDIDPAASTKILAVAIDEATPAKLRDLQAAYDRNYDSSEAA